MDNFIFSLNTTIPIFGLIILGWLLRQKKVVDQNFVDVTNKFVFHYTIPIMLFRDISSADIVNTFNLDYSLFCILSNTIAVAVIWSLARKFVNDKREIGSFVQGCFRGSAAMLGLAFVQNIYGSGEMAAVMIMSTVPLYNILSVLILTIEGSSVSGKIDRTVMKACVVNICKNPIILGILAGIPFSLMNITFPVMVAKTLNNISSLATPLALFALGAGFNGKEAVSKLKLTTIATIVKLAVIPGIFLPITVWLGYRNAELVALLVMLGSPASVNCYIMAKNMDNDADLASSIVVISTLFSSITLTIIIFIIKSLHLI